MSAPNLLNIDLNLLVAFEALVVEGHVSRAARRVGVSQPAMSRSLKQLREIFGDVLFQRTSEGMIPTPRAMELDRLIRPALETISQAIGQKAAFDASNVHRRFVMAMTDMAAYLALPVFMARIRKEAPNIDIEVRSTGPLNALEMAENGQVEFAIGTFDYLPSTMSALNLQRLHEVCVADPHNPAIGPGGIDLQLFLSLPHVAVAVEGQHGIPIDVVLETLGHRRRVALVLPHFLPVPRLVLGTDMLAVVVEDLLDSLPEGRSLTRHELPLPFEPVMGRIVWHCRHDHDQGHKWLRDFIAGSIQESTGVSV